MNEWMNLIKLTPQMGKKWGEFLFFKNNNNNYSKVLI